MRKESGSGKEENTGVARKRRGEWQGRERESGREKNGGSGRRKCGKQESGDLKLLSMALMEVTYAL